MFWRFYKIKSFQLQYRIPTDLALGTCIGYLADSDTTEKMVALA